MRIRGTALILHNNRVLLVRDKEKMAFSLPGGGTNRNEPSLAAAIRELKEELGMSAYSAERVFHCDYKGHLNEHKVCLVKTNDLPQISSSEIAEFIWWDTLKPILRYPHVDVILERFLSRKITARSPEKKGPASSTDVLGSKGNHYEHTIEGSWLGPPKKGQRSPSATSAESALNNGKNPHKDELPRIGIREDRRRHHDKKR